MRVTVLELAASYGEPARVLAEIDARLAAGPATDLVVVPEAALHGYVSPERDFDLSRFAEPLDGPTARATAALAAARGVHLLGSLVLREGDALYNAMTCFDPRGELAFVYRKRHPWLPETWATAGTQPPPVVTIAGARVTIAVCYDLHFIASDAARELAAADLLLFPSAWVERPDTRAARLAVLARQFDLQIANANWAPGVVRVPGQGGSCLVAADGTITVAPPAGRLDLQITP
ncbi:MAG TPA: carbon-nitrogen hydrolase family protein [Kofleriaceae bacterium]|nr:carbon-nitrogen hydrolase family protein [Kofleriaceae bacterium]